MNKKDLILEYVKTIAGTIFVMIVCLIILLAVVQHNVFKEQAIEDSQDENFEYYLIGVLIDKNNYLESQDPKNYKINLKLGILYEISKDYSHSEYEFKQSINKAPFDDFYPEYRLASLYLKENRLKDAQAVMDNISERPEKKLIEYKADIYSKLGDKYYAKGDYNNAIQKYQKSMFYYDVIKSTQSKNVKNSIASAYVYLAERYVDNFKIDEAISSLEMANSFVNAPILKYKLALLLVRSQPELAYKYFEDVFKKEPSIIDYDVYYNFLSEMAIESEIAGNISQGELYRYKAKKFREYYQNNLLSINDVSLEYANGEMSYNSWKKRYTMNLELQLRNISNYDLKSLFVSVVFKDENGVITDYFENIVDRKSPLKRGKAGPVINIKTFYKPSGRYVPNRDVTAEVSVSKLEKSYKLSLATVKMREVKRIKRHKSNWKTDFRNWLNQIKSKEKSSANKYYLQPKGQQTR